MSSATNIGVTLTSDRLCLYKKKKKKKIWQQRYNKGCLVKSFQSYGVIDRESDVHMTSFPLMSRVRVVFSLLWKVRVSYCDTDDVRSNEVRYAFYKSII